jgi:cell division protein FtsL
VTTYALPRPRSASQRRSLPLVQRRAGARAATPPSTYRMRRIGVLFGLLVVGALIAAVMFHVALAQNQVELERLEKRADKEQRAYELLMAENAWLSSPDRIRSRALDLGMVEPDPDELTYVRAPVPETPAEPVAPPNSLASWEEVKGEIASAP